MSLIDGNESDNLDFFHMALEDGKLHRLLDVSRVTSRFYDVSSLLN